MSKRMVRLDSAIGVMAGGVAGIAGAELIGGQMLGFDANWKSVALCLIFAICCAAVMGLLSEKKLHGDGHSEVDGEGL